MLTTRPRGTNDILPAEARAWRRLEQAIHAICREYGYGELRTPLFEHTELFQRGVGETTDVVEKEMYTFLDRGQRSLTLRPEGTAGAARAYLENHLGAAGLPVKLYYVSLEAFRYERPQAGRLRQHHQFGVEVFGAEDAAVDAEVIYLGLDLATRLGLGGLSVSINSIGCPECRAAYRKTLQAYYRPHLEKLCSDCQRRFDRNPLRLLDCKIDRTLAVGAPQLTGLLCAACAQHFAQLQTHLTDLGVDFTVDPTLVRGLDYYTRTVFEVKFSGLGAQDTVWGGGRYDGLIESVGGPPTPGVGFGLGMERFLLTLAACGVELGQAEGLDLFVAALGAAAQRAAVPLVARLRKAGWATDMDFLGRSLKAQLKHASRYPSRFVAILGDDELARGVVALKHLATGEQKEVALDALPEALGEAHA